MSASTEEHPLPFPFWGTMTVWYVGLPGEMLEVELKFSNDQEFRELIAYLRQRATFQLTRSGYPQPGIAPQVMAGWVENGQGKFPYSCPKHGDTKILPNKKGGSHTHYCAVKENEKWCGEKITR